jgi:hypothetical protein
MTYLSALVILFLVIASSAAPFNGGISGWKFTSAKADPALGVLLGSDIHGVLTRTQTESQGPLTVVIYAKSASGSFESASAWRKLIPFAKGVDPRKESINDRLYRVGDSPRYFAEVSSDVGADKMIPAMIFGYVSGGTAWLFVYENEREIYKQNSKDVMALFHQISESAKN